MSGKVATKEKPSLTSNEPANSTGGGVKVPLGMAKSTICLCGHTGFQHLTGYPFSCLEVGCSCLEFELAGEQPAAEAEPPSEGGVASQAELKDPFEESAGAKEAVAEPETKESAPASEIALDLSDEALAMIALEDIDPGENPRTTFEKLEELSASIKKRGLLQAITLRKKPVGPDGKQRYAIVMGERRFRATQMAGLIYIKAVVREADETSEVNHNNLIDALIENLQREGLNPIDEAQAYKDLIETHGFTHDQLAEELGGTLSRSAITNKMRNLTLPPRQIDMLRRGHEGDYPFTESHGLALCSIADTPAMVHRFTNLAIEGRWSSRKLREEIEAYKDEEEKRRAHPALPVLAAPEGTSKPQSEGEKEASDDGTQAGADTEGGRPEDHENGATADLGEKDAGVSSSDQKGLQGAPQASAGVDDSPREVGSGIPSEEPQGDQESVASGDGPQAQETSQSQPAGATVAAKQPATTSTAAKSPPSAPPAPAIGEVQPDHSLVQIPTEDLRRAKRAGLWPLPVALERFESMIELHPEALSAATALALDVNGGNSVFAEGPKAVFDELYPAPESVTSTMVVSALVVRFFRMVQGSREDRNETESVGIADENTPDAASELIVEKMEETGEANHGAD